MKLSRNFEPTVGASKIKLCTKFAKCELDDITRKPKEWIAYLELLIRDLKKPTYALTTQKL